MKPLKGFHEMNRLFWVCLEIADLKVGLFQGLSPGRHREFGRGRIACVIRDYQGGPTAVKYPYT